MIFIKSRTKYIIILGILLSLLTTSWTALATNDSLFFKNKINSLNTTIPKDDSAELLSRSFFKNILSGNKQNGNNKLNIFSSLLQTKCQGVEKESEVIFGIPKYIDVDNNKDTGQQGFDIKAQYLILPWMIFEPDFAIGLLFTVGIERIGSEIKDKDLNVSFSMGENNLRFGYSTPDIAGNEIPDFTRVSSIFLINPLLKYSQVSFYVNPQYSSAQQDKSIVLFAHYDDNEENLRRFSFQFDPPVETQIDLISSREDGKWQYKFERRAAIESKLTATIGRTVDDKEKVTTISIDKLPSDLSFLLDITPFGKEGGQFVYESEKMYDVGLQITTDELGICKYATLKNTPRKIHAQWTPTFLNGSYGISIDSDGTDFTLKDRLENPIINLSINNIASIDINATWNLTDSGDFTVTKNTGLKVDLKFKLGEWIAKLEAEPIATYISTTWHVDLSGYFTIDTNNQPLSTIDILIKGQDVGIEIIGESFKSEDFNISWTIWPIQDWNLDISGDIKFLSLSIDIYLKGIWYHLWPILNK
ncbi:MAG: hypothetical protein JXA91_07605 [Candidatus Thermoplasmatota archaeon]|nr:hypothetical protein [Candidatus Thermoplasmatota archaeon]